MSVSPRSPDARTHLSESSVLARIELWSLNNGSSEYVVPPTLAVIGRIFHVVPGGATSRGVNQFRQANVRAAFAVRDLHPHRAAHAFAHRKAISSAKFIPVSPASGFRRRSDRRDEPRAAVTAIARVDNDVPDGQRGTVLNLPVESAGLCNLHAIEGTDSFVMNADRARNSRATTLAR